METYIKVQGGVKNADSTDSVTADATFADTASADTASADTVTSLFLIELAQDYIVPSPHS